MIFFKKDKRNKNKVIDLSENYKFIQKKPSHSLSSTSSNNKEFNNEEYATLGFLGNIANNSSGMASNIQDNSISSFSSLQSESSQEKRSKLAKRLLDMTNKIEEISNQLYHLTQRIELIEKKLKMNLE